MATPTKEAKKTETQKTRKSPPPGKPFATGLELVKKGYMTAEKFEEALKAGEFRPNPKKRDLGPDTANYEALIRACGQATEASRQNGSNRRFTIRVKEPK